VGASCPRIEPAAGGKADSDRADDLALHASSRSAGGLAGQQLRISSYEWLRNRGQVTRNQTSGRNGPQKQNRTLPKLTTTHRKPRRLVLSTAKCTSTPIDFNLARTNTLSRNLERNRTVSKRKKPHPRKDGAQEYAGDHLISHTLTRAVPSAQRGLTSVFGMGTGVTLAVNSPANFRNLALAIFHN
jgi:hypothetical protein